MNLAALSLLPAALVGMAATIFGMWWLRVVHATLPGTIPASELALPVILVSAGLGATAAGRLADRRPWLFATTARLAGLATVAVLAAGWLLEALRPAPDVPAVVGLGRLVVAGLPVVPAMFLMAGVLPALSLARARRGVPVVRSTGSVMSAMAGGGAFGAVLFAEILISPAGPRLWSAACLAAAAFACAVLTRLSGPTRPWSEDRWANPTHGLEFVGLLAWLLTGGVLFMAAQAGLARMVEQRMGDSLATTQAVVMALLTGIAAGSAVLAWSPRQLPASLLACGCLLVTGVALTIPDLAWRHADMTYGVIALVAPLGMGCGSLVAAASRARVRRPERLGSWVGDLFALWLAGGLAGRMAYVWR